MIRLLTAALLFASFSVVAETEVPHKFQQGEVIDAQKFNEDFEALEAAIDANEAALPPTNCTTDQIIRWDGTNDVWVCATDPFAGLNCTVGDQLRMGSGGWECSAEPITASLIQDSWDDQGGVLAPITTYFDSVNNVKTTSSCDGSWCVIEVIGVDDYARCVTQVTGGAILNSAYDAVDIRPGLDGIQVGRLETWVEGGDVSINISCAP